MQPHLSITCYTQYRGQVCEASAFVKYYRDTPMRHLWSIFHIAYLYKLDKGGIIVTILQIVMAVPETDHIARAIQYVKHERSRALTEGERLDILRAQAMLRQQGKHVQ